MKMKGVSLGILLAALLLAGVVLYRYRFGNNLNVTPEAAEEIGKAKRR
jgi:hypothetical protein